MIPRLVSAILITWCGLLFGGAGTMLEAQSVLATATTPAEIAGVRIEPAAPLSLFASPPPTGDTRAHPPLARERPSRHLFSPLYAGLIATQALDVHSTLRALDAGYAEANPMVRWATANPVALVSVKAATTVGTIFVTERMRKKHPKSAMVLLAALDTASAFVIAHNYSAPISNR